MKVYVRVLEGGAVDAVSTVPQPDVQVEAEVETSILYLEKLKGYEVRADEETGILFMRFDEKRYQEAVKREEEAEAKAKAYAAMQSLMTQSVLDTATDEQALVMRPLYPMWQVDQVYKKGAYLQYGGKLYRVLQDHTSQADWTPDKAVSLYVNVADPQDPFPPYKAPTGAHDAYKKGDGVTFEGKRYLSKINGNVHSPAEYPDGWELVE